VLVLVSVGALAYAATIGNHVPNPINNFSMSVLTGGGASLYYPACNCDLLHRAYKSLQESAVMVRVRLTQEWGERVRKPEKIAPGRIA
jgi:hypothetical protein